MTISTPQANQNVASAEFSTKDVDWQALEKVLRPYVRNRIYILLPSYRYGDANGLIEETLQETYLRVLPSIRKAEYGLIPPIISLEAFCKVVALRFLLDVRHKHKKIMVSLDTPAAFGLEFDLFLSDDPAEFVITQLIDYSKWLMVAKAVKQFPPKLKQAVLVHLANETDFDDEQPRPLEQAFRASGILLRTYRRELPSNPVLLQRHRSLVSLGMKTLRAMLQRNSSQVFLKT